MVPVEKPKSVKLWKKSNNSTKKQKSQQEDSNPQLEMKKTKRKAPEEQPPPELPEVPKEKAKKEQNLKRKTECADAPAAKKSKPDNLTRKQWKMLHLDKKGKKAAPGGEEATKLPRGKPENMSRKEWKKLKLEKKGKAENFEIGQKLKGLWENLRREDCKAEEKKKLLKQACDVLKGRIMEFTFAHDTVRVVECVVAEGSDADRTFIFNEVQNEIIPLTKSKYGKFVIMKLLRYGSKDIKNTIMKAFHGKVVKLIKHTEAAEVVELAFNEDANATQRFELVQEFYGPSFKFFKTTECHDLGSVFKAEPEKKSTIIQNMKVELMKVLEKTVVKHSIVHHVLWQFMQHADPVSKAEIIESVRDAVPEILHSKDGSRVGMHCVWFGNNKDRKMIVKAMKTFVTKIAMEEHGHMVLLALIDCYDDTKLLEKRIILELEQNLLQVSQNIHGKKVLVSLLNPRDSHYIHPDVINILKTGDSNEHSKKDPLLRQQELRLAVSMPLLSLVKDNIGDLYKDNPFCLFSLTVLKHSIGEKNEVFQAIAELVIEPYTTENKNVHAIEHPGSNFLFKQLIFQEKNCSKDKDTFSEILISRVPNMVFKSWVECNRGAFLLVSLIETQIPAVVERIKRDLDGCKKYLAKKNYKGAEILLKKLKE